MHPFLTDPADMVSAAREHGFFVLRDFFPAQRVRAVRAELEPLFDDDCRRREQSAPAPVTHNDGGIVYELTDAIHSIFLTSFIHPGYAALWAEVFAHPAIQDFLRHVAGPAVRMRVDLVRRATGVDDTVDSFQLPHGWHRDSPGEFTFGLFFDDFTRPSCGATTVLPGTHWTAFNPIWDFVLGSGRHYTTKANYLRDECVWLPEDLAETAVANREYQSTLAGAAVEVGGAPGDLYFFFNDIHHGRAPNRTGERLMVSRFGGFSAAYAFKDDVPLPAMPAWYPSALAEAYAPKPRTEAGTFLLAEMAERRRGSTLAHLARLEKRLLVREAEERLERSRQQQKTEALEAEVASLKAQIAALTTPRR